jgi:hypothetical protein
MPGRSAKCRLRWKSPFLSALCSVPPTQSCPATAAGAPGGAIASASSRFAIPSPLPIVSQVAKSAGIASTRGTVPAAGSTSLTWPSWFGSFVTRCETYTFPSGATAMPRASGHASGIVFRTARSAPRTTSALGPWHVTYSSSPAPFPTMAYGAQPNGSATAGSPTRWTVSSP